MKVWGGRGRGVIAIALNPAAHTATAPARLLRDAPVHSWSNPDTALKLFKERKKKKALQQGFGQQAVFSFHRPTNKLLHGSLPLSALVPAYSCPTKPHLVRPAPSPASKAWVCHAMWLRHSTPERHSTCLQVSGPPLRSHSPEYLPTWSPSMTKCLQRDSREPVKETLRKRAWLKPGPPLAFLLILKACPHSPGSTQEWLPQEACELVQAGPWHLLGLGACLR